MAEKKDQPNNPSQEGAPQRTQEMPSSGNSPQRTSDGSRIDDIERSGISGAGIQRAADTSVTGDPGRTPGKAEGVEEPERQGNE